MILKTAPYMALLFGLWSCNQPNKISPKANISTNQDTIGFIPMKYFAIAGVPQDSAQGQKFHKIAVDYFNDSITTNLHALDSAQFYYENAYRIRYKWSPKHWTTGKTLLNLAKVFGKNKDFIASERCLEHALLTDAPSVKEQIYIRGEMNALLADCYNELAEARLAQKHYLKAIEIFQSIDNQPACKSPYLGLANYYKMANRSKEAMQYVQKYRMVYDIKDNSDIGKGFLTEGSIFRLQKSYNNSITALNRALEHFKDPNSATDKGGTYIELAKTLLETNQLAEARNAIEAGLKIWLQQEIKIPDLIEGYMISGKIYEKLNKKKEAIEEYEKAGQFGQGYGWFLFEPLFQKAQLLSKTDLLKAYQTYLTLDSVIMQSRFQIKSDSAKLTWAKQTHQAYEKMIGVATQLHYQTKEVPFLHKIHHFISQSKSVLLTADWAKMEARQIANVPTSILEKEKNIYKTLLINQQESSKKNNIQKATDDLTAFESHLEREYPQYHSAKYAYLKETTTAIAPIQKYLKLNEDTGLIEYFYGKDTIYSLSWSANGLFLHQLLVSEVDSTLKIFEKHCTTGALTLSDTALIQKNYDLYQKLVEPSVISFQKVNRLRIVCDGLLNQLSFDALLTRPCDSLPEVQPLLLQKYSISYLETLHQAVAKNNLKKQTGSDFGAMSFHYNSVNAPIDNLKFGKLDSLPNTLWRLKENLFSQTGHYWSDKSKSDEKYSILFKKAVPQHRVMIFGGHGQAHFEQPLESMIAFPPNDSLTGFDVLSMETGCNQLIVPLACQTGIGMVERGEGMLSFSRGFIRAGYPAVTGSLWSVPEATSAAIIRRFTENLQNGLPKDKAMQQAKIAFLKKASHNDRLYRNWAGHVLYGNAEPIDFQSDSNHYGFWVGAFFLSLLVGKIIFRK